MPCNAAKIVWARPSPYQLRYIFSSLFQPFFHPPFQKCYDIRPAAQHSSLKSGPSAEIIPKKFPRTGTREHFFSIHLTPFERKSEESGRWDPLSEGLSRRWRAVPRNYQGEGQALQPSKSRSLDLNSLVLLLVRRGELHLD